MAKVLVKSGKILVRAGKLVTDLCRSVCCGPAAPRTFYCARTCGEQFCGLTACVGYVYSDDPLATAGTVFRSNGNCLTVDTSILYAIPLADGTQPIGTLPPPCYDATNAVNNCRPPGIIDPANVMTGCSDPRCGEPRPCYAPVSRCECSQSGSVGYVSIDEAAIEIINADGCAAASFGQDICGTISGQNLQLVPLPSGAEVRSIAYNGCCDCVQGICEPPNSFDAFGGERLAHVILYWRDTIGLSDDLARYAASKCGCCNKTNGTLSLLVDSTYYQSDPLANCNGYPLGAKTGSYKYSGVGVVGGLTSYQIDREIFDGCGNPLRFDTESGQGSGAVPCPAILPYIYGTGGGLEFPPRNNESRKDLNVSIACNRVAYTEERYTQANDGAYYLSERTRREVEWSNSRGCCQNCATEFLTVANNDGGLGGFF
jgi:hypothetical protein